MISEDTEISDSYRAPAQQARTAGNISCRKEEEGGRTNTIFSPRNVDWECMTIGHEIIPIGDIVKEFIDNRVKNKDFRLLYIS